MSDLPNFLPALPELFMAASALVLLLLGVFAKKDITSGIAALVVFVMIFAAALVPAAGASRAEAFGGMFVVDAFGVFTKVLVLAASALSLCMSVNWMRKEGAERFEFPVDRKSVV